MNIPITADQYGRFDGVTKLDLIYGSRLFNVHREDSDYDIISLYDYNQVFKEKFYYPNIHSFKYEDTENNVDRVLMTHEQFWNAFYSGDGTMYADIVLFNENIFLFDSFKLSGTLSEKRLAMCRTYKVIKGYCGTAKRDLASISTIKDAVEKEKIIRRSTKNLYIAECLIENIFPEMETIQKIFLQDPVEQVSVLAGKETLLRQTANDLFNAHKIENYFIHKTEDDLLNIMLHGNNLKEYIFKK